MWGGVSGGNLQLWGGGCMDFDLFGEIRFYKFAFTIMSL